MKKEQAKEIIDRFCKGDTSPLIAKEVGVDMNEFTELLTAFRHCKDKVMKAHIMSRTKILYMWLIDNKGYKDSQIMKLFGIKNVNHIRGADKARANKISMLISNFCEGNTGYDKAEELGISLKDYKVILEAYGANTEVKYLHGSRRASVLYTWLYTHENYDVPDIIKLFGVSNYTVNKKLNEQYTLRIAKKMKQEETKKKEGRICSSGAVFSNKSEFWRKR